MLKWRIGSNYTNKVLKLHQLILRDYLIWFEICFVTKSIAATFSSPRGIMISAYLMVGNMNSSNDGLTNREYWQRTP